ncbi:hypothetical protein Esi_0000_0510 [Ectocarpus siliculosus]|uniref:Replitron HUH endonuclease domain-containing protein n=1 Tax=Ectocarpus siliculosus TaxID=2880 RepID=D8LBK2_ECTSI|nr:hypothetical protein Esi_0000_0510 [Ectocarpus siliculosus]|eukprot:CBN76711.1 hypothetical protein Esi_0000_0510 [Ectocarpus siliculosus]
MPLPPLPLLLRRSPRVAVRVVPARTQVVPARTQVVPARTQVVPARTPVVPLPRPTAGAGQRVEQLLSLRRPLLHDLGRHLLLQRQHRLRLHQRPPSLLLRLRHRLAVLVALARVLLLPGSQPSWICPTTGDIADDIIDSGVGAPHDFSVTIGNRSGANIKESLFNEGCAWMTKRAVRGVTSMERGDMNGNLHLQGIWTLALKKDFGDSKKEEAALRRKLRVDCGWTAADKVKITIKRLIKQQTFSGMVGDCSKDEGRSHFKTVTKGVSRTEVNIALTEYRTLQRSVVSELRTEIGKKNFWGVLRRFKQEHLRGISVSPVQLISWYINDGEGMPSHTWICPTSAFAMEAARADAYFTALMSPSLFTRKDAYLLFFSGGQGGRVSGPSRSGTTRTASSPR